MDSADEKGVGYDMYVLCMYVAVYACVCVLLVLVIGLQSYWMLSSIVLVEQINHSIYLYFLFSLVYFLAVFYTDLLNYGYVIITQMMVK